MANFYMLLLRRPVSLNAANQKYKSALKDEASKVAQGSELLAGRLYARIIWFHKDPTTQDVDNIVKPILDSLKGVVFEDDSQIGECRVMKIDTSRPYTFVGEPETKIFEELSKFLAREEKHVLFVEVGLSPEQIADFGMAQEDV
ncbi:RusA family crossover junction endodeoxyribonuclease [bacterium]|nr:MAG: RusA family crossover junction endodeoxyribonuclease [bacterium]